MRRGLQLAVLVVAAVAVPAQISAAEPALTPGLSGPAAPLPEIHKIRHVVIIMQENRSFDSYFGTYPGADGIPGLAGHPGRVPCVPDPQTGTCVKPYHDRTLVNVGGPHTNDSFVGDLDHGRMDGFIKSIRSPARPARRTM
jgi:phospholipase C